jgi:putative flavoprotein involved in K+ transport
MYASILDVIVVGAGHAGLSISYHLKKHNVNHIVFEKGKIGDSWHNQRWDSFKLNTPNKWNLLPGQESIFSDSEGLCSASEFVAFLEGYSAKFQLPVVENCEVISVESIPESKEFSVSVSENGSTKNYRCSQVVVASGAQNKKNIPLFARNLSSEIFQLHSSEYRNVSSLPDGAVLVVGSAQSGIQIAEDLISEGRKVFISTSQVGRVPRRYRGKDIVDWLIITGFYDQFASDVADKQILTMKQPQISTVGVRGHSSSLQALAKNGAVILGKIENANALTVFLKPDAAANVKFADESSMKVKEMINQYIQKTQLYAPPPEEDLGDAPDEKADCVSAVTSLNLIENNITTIIWTTGFVGDYSYLKLPVFNDNGMPRHHNGISDINGLYFLGMPWLRKRKSGIILGIEEDAKFIAKLILAHSGIKI